MCSLNLIEPHLRPDPRRIPSDDPGTDGYDPRNLYASYCFVGICANPRYFQQIHRVSEPAGLLTARIEP
jgi:hypothetical protein